MSISARRLSGCFVFLILCLCGGCYSFPPAVVLHTAGPPKQSIGVTFGRSYFATSPTGEDQIVLLGQPIDEAAGEKPGTPLKRQTNPALNQLLRIQLLWRTAPAGNSDSAVADNAVIHWYVYGDPGDGSMSIINYVGTGAVSFSVSGGIAKVAIHNAEVRATGSNGVLHDPFGSFKITGRFKAVADSDQVRQIIDDVDSATAKASVPR